MKKAQIPIKGNHHDAAVWKFDYGDNCLRLRDYREQTRDPWDTTFPRSLFAHITHRLTSVPQMEIEVRLPAHSTCWLIRTVPPCKHAPTCAHALPVPDILRVPGALQAGRQTDRQTDRNSGMCVEWNASGMTRMHPSIYWDRHGTDLDVNVNM